ncbi:MAG: type II secretion system protein [Candidatus Paceibacterota bacterium]
MKYHKSRGFTLIELLVVMSIVSVLSSLIIASMSAARNQAKNARMIESVGQLRNLFEQGWNGNSYTDFAYASDAGSMGFTSVVATNSFTNPKITSTINDILAQNGGAYGGGTYSFGTDGCTPGSPAYLTMINDGGYDINGLTIYVSPACGPVKSYAIYSSKIPLKLTYFSPIEVAYANALPTHLAPNEMSGYFCLDSSGNSIKTNDGWIPGYTGTFPDSYTTKDVTDGKCH